ncbi:glycoside hydrolase family 36 protein [Lachnospiraceae bacterium JLR.KK008]
MGYVEVERDNLYLCFCLEAGQEAKLLKASSARGNWQPGGIWGDGEETDARRGHDAARVVEIQKAGGRHTSFRGAKNFYDIPQTKLCYVGHEMTKNRLTIRQRGESLLVRTTYHFYDGLPVFSCETCVENEGEEDVWLYGVTSFCYGNVTMYEEGTHGCKEDLQIYYACNTWSEECRWVHKSLGECGVIPYGNLSYDRFFLGNHSGFSSGEYLPMGAVYNLKDNESIVWQIESSGAWFFETGAALHDYRESFLDKKYDQWVYLLLSGPTMESGYWQKKLAPGDSFTTVPAAVGFYHGRPEEGLTALTAYRRKKKRVEALPVIFNDYMNCLMGDSTTELLRPYIKRAAQAGCEIFVVDCGWYDTGDWQYTFGTFEECEERYPGGLCEVMDEIRACGMKPGLWLELEAFGIDNERADSLPSDWIFTMHGKPVVDSGRYHLDYRNPQVRKHASAIVKRVVETYRLSYLKIDYNLCLCWGTDYDSDSPGDGLLAHNRAYLSWLEQEMKKYPHVIWENCGSGGLRMDYALLSRMDIQSVSDQEDYRIMAMIAANCASAVLPEQAGIWAYPRREGDMDETVMNMVSAMPFRICLGGHLAELSEERFALVREAIDCYKEIRSEIPKMTPCWPLGLHAFDCGWLCFGLKGETGSYLTVIRRNTEKETIVIPMETPLSHVRILYPSASEAKIQLVPGENDRFRITLPRQNMGCFLRVD